MAERVLEAAPPRLVRLSGRGRGRGCAGSTARASVEARIVLGAVASRPMAADKAVALLTGEELTDDVIASVAIAASEVAKPMDNTDFELVWRKKMVRSLVSDALREVRGDDMRARRRQISRLELV